MTSATDAAVLDAVLDAWERSNAALIGLLRLLPAGALEARATATSPSVGQMCAHVQHERMISVAENAPEHAGTVPPVEWASQHDVDTLVAGLSASCSTVANAVRGRVRDGRSLDRDFAHPVQLVHFLIFHDGYHHGQIRLALKACGHALADADVGEHVWDVWRARAYRPTARSGTLTTDPTWHT